MSRRFLITIDHTCPYFEDRTARNLICDPEHVDAHQYDLLAKLGFRRNGDMVYRPACPDCSACRSLRIDVRHFQPNRSQQRNDRRNADLDVALVTPPNNDSEYYALFQHYLQHRHPDSSMNEGDLIDFRRFLFSDWGRHRLLELRQKGTLLGFCVVDVLHDGYSAVYSCYIPEHPERGLGTLLILQLIEQARRQHLPWVYLGYWIEECSQMNYKCNFKPYQTYDGERWQPSV